MNRKAVPILMLAVVASLGCDDDDLTTPDFELFGADLTGDQEVPPVETDASGDAAFEWDGTTMAFAITVEDITDATAAHIHRGEAGENGDILVTLFPGPTVEGDFSGVLVEGAFTEPDEDVDITMDELLDLMRTGGAYVNVHTEENPAGEIRGQVEELEEF